MTEREAIVAFLNQEADSLKDAGPIGKVVFAVLMDCARKIDAGEHLPAMPSGDPDRTDCDGPAGGGAFSHTAIAKQRAGLPCSGEGA